MAWHCGLSPACAGQPPNHPSRRDSAQTGATPWAAAASRLAALPLNSPPEAAFSDELSTLSARARCTMGLPGVDVCPVGVVVGEPEPTRAELLLP